MIWNVASEPKSLCPHPSERESQRFVRQEGLDNMRPGQDRPSVVGLTVSTGPWARKDLQSLAEKSGVCGTFRGAGEAVVMFSRMGFKASTDFALAVHSKTSPAAPAVQRILAYPDGADLQAQTWDSQAGRWTPPVPL